MLYQHLHAGTPSWHGVVGPADVLDGLRSRDRTVQKFNASVVPTVRCLHFVLVFPCLDLLAVVACLILVIIQLTVVLVVQCFKICNIIFEAALTTWLFLYAFVFSLDKGQPSDVVCQVVLFLV